MIFTWLRSSHSLKTIGFTTSQSTFSNYSLLFISPNSPISRLPDSLISPIQDSGSPISRFKILGPRFPDSRFWVPDSPISRFKILGPRFPDSPTVHENPHVPKFLSFHENPHVPKFLSFHDYPLVPNPLVPNPLEKILSKKILSSQILSKKILSSQILSKKILSKKILSKKILSSQILILLLGGWWVSGGELKLRSSR
jgi:hypothetical protein